MGRFVVHEHARDGHRTHWDLMLERGDTLQTFRLEAAPAEAANEGCPAARIFDHPLKFLAYEGPVNAGSGRVSRADSGTYQIIEQGPGRLRASFSGQVLKGWFDLVQVRGRNWRFGPAKSG